MMQHPVNTGSLRIVPNTVLDSCSVKAKANTQPQQTAAATTTTTVRWKTKFAMLSIKWFEWCLRASTFPLPKRTKLIYFHEKEGRIEWIVVDCQSQWKLNNHDMKSPDFVHSFLSFLLHQRLGQEGIYQPNFPRRTATSSTNLSVSLSFCMIWSR